MSMNVLRRGTLIMLALAIAACGGGTQREHQDDWKPGIPKRAGRIIADKQEGTWTYWHANGAKQAEGGFAADRQNGAWTWWYPDGTTEQQGAYASGGLRVGAWRFCYADGKPRAAGSYGQGAPVGADPAAWPRPDRQHGAWRYWHANGRPAAQGFFVDGVKSLVWTAWDEQGIRLEQGAYWRGMKVGPWLERADGIERLVDRGCPGTHVCTRDQATGQPTRWAMLAGTPAVGLRLAFAADGTPRVASLDDDGVQHGMAWLDDGRLILASAHRGQAEIESWFHPEADAGPGAVLDEDVIAARERRVAEDQAALRQPIAAPVASTPAATPPTVTAPTPTVHASPLARMPLSPLPALPGFWTPREEANAGRLIAAYTHGVPVEDDGYAWSSKPGGPSRQRQDLHGRPLGQTRLLNAVGEVVDLADSARAGRACLIVIMRGFSGQVCLYCATQTAALVDNLARFAAAHTDVVLLYPGPAESVPAFLAAVHSLGKDVPSGLLLAIDPDLTLVRELALEDQLAKPTTLLLDRAGVVRWTYMGRARDDRPAVADLLTAIGRLP